MLRPHVRRAPRASIPPRHAPRVKRRRPAPPAAPQRSRASSPVAARAQASRWPAAHWAIVLFALGLRLWHLAEGLPDFFEEAFPLRRAFEMAGWERGRIDWNPHAFHYPSLTFYLHLLLQGAQYRLGLLLGVFHRRADFFVAEQVDPSAVALWGRALGLAADLALVACVIRLGERLRRGAGLLAGLLVALSATLIHGSHTIVTDGVMAALALWAVERMIAYRAGAGAGALAAASLLTGLAIGAKYPAALLVIPLVWAITTRRDAGWLTLVPSLAGVMLTFAATSPFLFASAAQARFDLLRIADLVSQGQLGSFEHPSALYYLRTLARDFGWLALALLGLALITFRRAPERERGLAGVWLYLIAFAAPMVLGRVEFERYLVPIVPAAALLLAVAALAAPEVWPALPLVAREPVRALLILALAAPAAWSGFGAAAVGGDTTQGRARRFIEAHLSEDQLVVQEAHGAPLRDRWEAQRVTSSPAFAAADPAWQQRYRRQPVVRAVRIPLLVAGRAVVVAPDSVHGRREIELFPSSADLDRVFYEPALFAAVDWVATSDAVRGRYEADPRRYARQHDFYRWLERAADSVAIARSGGTVTGPEIRLYHLAPRFRAGAGAPLDPLWWTRDVPDRARAELEQAMRGLGPPRAEPDAPPSWVLGLGALFENQIEPFVYPLALEQADLGRCSPALALANAILRMDPGHVQATGIVVSCAEAENDMPRAREAIARLLQVRDPSGAALPDIRLEYARLLAQTGARDEARRQLGRVLGAPLAGDAQQRAREMLRALDRPPHP